METGPGEITTLLGRSRAKAYLLEVLESTA